MKLLTKLVACFLLLAGLASAQNLVLTNAKIYPSPTTLPIEGATIVIRDGKIENVSMGKVRVEKGSDVIDCKGKVVVAGFWNSHVHFSDDTWKDAEKATADKLESHMQEMLTHWGFTTVWDLGSEPRNTLALRKRVEAGEVPGPKILMAGDIFPKGGHPVYLPAELQLPEAATPADALRMVRGYFYLGLDGTKLFTGSYMGRDKPVINMDPDIVKSAVDITHEMHRPVFAHPQNHAGVDVALNGGVDILAHTIPSEGSFTDAELAQMKKQHTGLIPTLTLFTTVVNDPAIQEVLVGAGVSELKTYFDQGGMILFGTDVGFVKEYDTAQEYEFMGRAMAWKDILASLTTNPAEFFKEPTKGRVEQGMDADLVVLDADPATDVKNFAKVRMTVRSGKIIYQEK